jgi:hypothetical protein
VSLDLSVARLRRLACLDLRLNLTDSGFSAEGGWTYSDNRLFTGAGKRRRNLTKRNRTTDNAPRTETDVYRLFPFEGEQSYISLLEQAGQSAQDIIIWCYLRENTLAEFVLEVGAAVSQANSIEVEWQTSTSWAARLEYLVMECENTNRDRRIKHCESNISGQLQTVRA